MITISNCPITGLNRRLEYNFLWYRTARQLIIECHVQHFKDGEHIDNVRIKDYTRNLVASDSLVNPSTGVLLTEQELANISSLGYTPVEEYDFYAQLGRSNVVLEQQVEYIIGVRDQEGKFNSI